MENTEKRGFWVLVLWLGVMGVALLPVAGGAVPQMINYQGYLTDAGGNPISATVPIVFSLYSAASGGTALWTETQNVVVASGVYSANLGSVNPITLPFDALYYLGVKVGTDPEMTPRKILTAVGYAFRALTADTVVGSGSFTNPIVSTVSTGTAPLQVSSTTAVTNLNADLLDGQHAEAFAPASHSHDSSAITSGVLPLERGGTGSSTKSFADLSTFQTIGGYKTFSNPIQSAVAVGTPPLYVDSTTMVWNFNAEMISGKKISDLDNRYGLAPFQNPRSNIITTVDAGDTGTFNSITIGTDGLPIISYYGFAFGSAGWLKVAKCGNPSCSSNNTIAIMGPPQIGMYSSIAIGTDGFPIISCYDSTNYDLIVLKCSIPDCSGGNTRSTVDSAGVVGQHTSITIGTDGLPFISYYDSTNSDLKVAKCGNAACSSGNTLFTVDSTGVVGQYTSVIIGTDGFPVISYYDGTNGNLKIAKCGNAACSSGNTLSTVDSTGVVGQYTSITIGIDGFPVISYYDNTNRNLKVAKCSNHSCSSSVTVSSVDSMGLAGEQSTAITIGTDGFPVISYYDGTNGNLKIAKCGNAACSSGNSLFAVDTGGVGQHSSITIGTDGLPIISYYDLTNYNLKAAKCTNSFCLNNWSRR